MSWPESKKSLPEKHHDPVGYELALVTLASCPDLEEAKALIEEQLDCAEISVKRLEALGRSDDLEKVRQELAPKLEANLTLKLGDEARRATSIVELALERTQARLQRNDISEPWKVAREVSQVRTQGIDKKLALEGRPTAIHETRNTDEVIRQLEAMGVATQTVIEGTAVEEG